MDLKTPISGVLSNALKFDTSKIDSLLDESKSPAEIEAALSSTLAEHIEKVLAPERAKNEQQKLYGIKEGAKIYQKPLQELLGSKSEGQDLLNELSEKMNSTNALDDDKVKVHPLYRSLNDSVNTLKTEHETAINKLKTEHEEEKQFAGVKDSIVWPAVTKAGYIMPTNQNQANILRNQFESELAKAKPEVQSDGKVFAKLNGEYVKDAHQNVIPYDVYATTLAANYFDVANNNGGQSSQNGGNGGTGGGKQPQKFKTAEELSIFVNDKNNSLEDRKAAQTQWLAEHPE